MARARKASDEIYNARRRAKRLVNSLNKELSKGVSPMKADAIRSRISDLEAQIKTSYSPRAKSERTDAGRKYREQIARKMTSTVQNYRTTQKISKSKDEEVIARANKAWSEEARRASKGDTDTRFTEWHEVNGEMVPDDKAPLRVKAFWASTRNMWAGAKNADREAIVLAKLGVSTLDEAYDIVMAQPQTKIYYGTAEEIADANERMAEDGMSTRERDYIDDLAMKDYVAGEEERTGSPTFWWA